MRRFYKSFGVKGLIMSSLPLKIPATSVFYSKPSTYFYSRFMSFRSDSSVEAENPLEPL
jgi:hypothetical protein